MTGMVADMTVNEQAMKKAAGAGYSTATDLADWLVRDAGLPFREAHHVTGRAVALADQRRKVALDRLPLADLQALASLDHRRRVLGALGAELGEEPQILRRHGPAGGAPADPLLAQAAGEGVIGQGCKARHSRLQMTDATDRTTDNMTARTVALAIAMAAALATVSAAGARRSSTRPTRPPSTRARTRSATRSRCRRSRKNRSPTSRSSSTASSTDASEPEPAAVNHFDYRDGVLHAEDVAIPAIAAAVGTPFYCYSTATLERHYRVFSEAFAGLDALVCYAMKANSNQAVLRTLAKLGAGADVVSEGELRRALAAGIPPARSFLGRRQDRAEMDFALEPASTASTSNPSRSSSCSRRAPSPPAAPRRCRCASIRTSTPGRTAKIATGKAENKFGIPWQRARDVYARAAESCRA
jgi:hypothetical protein